MKKILTIMIAAAIAISAMTSCSVSVGNSKDGDSSQNSSSVSNNSNDEEDKDSDDIFSWKITIEGDEYTIPCHISEFEKNGWELSNPEGTLDSNQYSFSKNLVKGDKIINVQLLNDSSDTKDFTDCKVGSVEVALSQGVNVELPCGLVFDENTTVESIKAVYGEPSSENDAEDYTTLYYKEQVYSEIEFFLYKADDRKSYSTVTMENFNS